MLSERDREALTVKYDGQDISLTRFIVGDSISANNLIAAIVEKCLPVGYLHVEILEIENFEEYANGAEMESQVVRRTRIPVYRMDDNVLIPLESTSGFPNVFVKALIALDPASIVVLCSNHRSYFVGESEFPTLFTMTKNPPTVGLPTPNILTGIAAGLFVRSSADHKDCVVLYLFEEDFGPTVESMELWANEVVKYMQIVPQEVAYRAVEITTEKTQNLASIYS